ncbi:antibiotic acetyltransferase [Staphylococcus cohnii]|uniref:CatB-related O-acetyltransferase n=1 Tax=Staphylococcus cohnii TaxID=29382 RepID=UPI000E6835EF|nr:CatB-related O-acetyltransferase [Staphylococcus cohnii]RIL71871.1 antibiotic acetyltransferase [Staphylococcus cohnii]
MKILRKIIFRSIRILKFKKGIYGNVGEKNKIGSHTFISEGATIGNYNYIGPFCMVNNAEIANYCSIGPNVKLGQAEHSKNFLTTSQLISKNLINHSLNKSKTLINSDVWLAANVTVLQGVEIGVGSIIGANAVVTKNIPPYAIAVGVPAKVVKYRFDESTIDRLLESKWYLNDLNKAKTILKEFNYNKEVQE